MYRYPYLNGDWRWVVKNTESYFREGVTFTDLTSGKLSMRWMPPGFAFDRAGNCLFPIEGNLWSWLALLNSHPLDYLMHINPTIHFYLSDFNRMPIPLAAVFSSDLAAIAQRCTRMQKRESSSEETTFDFVTPPRRDTGLIDLAAALGHLADMEARIDEEVYRLYGISDQDETSAPEDEEAEEPEAPVSREELAVRWLSYAVGVVLGRFQPGVASELGSGVYQRADFAGGSLPVPGEVEFNELVGPPESFAYVDNEGGRHLFPVEVETALRELVVIDGIVVLDEGHPRDLSALVMRALSLMLGDEGAQEVIAEGTNGDLRQFLERDYFTKWHLKWYRKRPVYWPLQSARRSYGFALFHERVDRNTLYTLQRDYLDHKIKGLELEIGDLQSRLEGLSGAARKEADRQIDQLTQLLEEVGAFAETIERIVDEGYNPESNWINDGVILRMASLWELIPIWSGEPKKYWGLLQKGDYDWSHIAMNYWPERVREKCKTNKSFAIAHGHEEWYEGA